MPNKLLIDFRNYVDMECDYYKGMTSEEVRKRLSPQFAASCMQGELMDRLESIIDKSLSRFEEIIGNFNGN